jgi:hypothetical protein
MWTPALLPHPRAAREAATVPHIVLWLLRLLGDVHRPLPVHTGREAGREFRIVELPTLVALLGPATCHTTAKRIQMSAASKESDVLRLPYTYVNATVLVGGINMTGPPELTIVDKPGLRIMLTGNANSHLLGVDKGIALANIRLDAMFGGGNLAASLDDRITWQIEKIQSDRTKRIGNQAVVILVGTGEQDVIVGDSLQEYPDFLIVQNGTRPGLFPERYREALDSIKAAIALEIGLLDHFEPLTEGVFFEWKDGRPLYNYVLSLSAGRASVAYGATQDHASGIGRRFAGLQNSPTLRTTQRLVARMADEHSDLLRQFVFGWIALEIFINQSFAEHERKFLAPMLEGGAIRLREQLLTRLREVMKSRYGLVGRFLIVTATLFPAASLEEQEVDLATFMKIKKARDDLLHGDDISEESLPIADLKRLQRKLIGERTTA